MAASGDEKAGAGPVFGISTLTFPVFPGEYIGGLIEGEAGLAWERYSNTIRNSRTQSSVESSQAQFWCSVDPNCDGTADISKIMEQQQKEMKRKENGEMMGHHKYLT